MTDQQEPQDDTHANHPARRSPPVVRDARTHIRSVIVVVILVRGALTFWVQNREKVEIEYLSVTITAPLWIVAVGYVAFGMIVGGLLVHWYRPRD